MIKYLVLIILPSILFFSCRTSNKEDILGTWTRIRHVKDGEEVKKQNDDTDQIRFLDDGEMMYLTNGERSGIGFYSYRIFGDSIYLTGIEVDSLGNRDSTFLFSDKFSIRTDTATFESKGETVYFKKEAE